MCAKRRLPSTETERKDRGKTFVQREKYKRMKQKSFETRELVPSGTKSKKSKTRTRERERNGKKVSQAISRYPASREVFFSSFDLFFTIFIQHCFYIAKGFWDPKSRKKNNKRVNRLIKLRGVARPTLRIKIERKTQL